MNNSSSLPAYSITASVSPDANATGNYVEFKGVPDEEAAKVILRELNQRSRNWGLRYSSEYDEAEKSLFITDGRKSPGSFVATLVEHYRASGIQFDAPKDIELDTDEGMLANTPDEPDQPETWAERVSSTPSVVSYPVK